jgi:hypothetical protein
MVKFIKIKIEKIKLIYKKKLYPKKKLIIVTGAALKQPK